jgi:FMN phosphatase YigB (HAD superfamily)
LTARLVDGIGALAELRPLTPGRILAVGDSLDHDIAHAADVGLAAVAPGPNTCCGAWPDSRRPRPAATAG